MTAVFLRNVWPWYKSSPFRKVNTIIICFANRNRTRTIFNYICELLDMVFWFRLLSDVPFPYNIWLFALMCRIHPPSRIWVQAIHVEKPEFNPHTHQHQRMEFQARYFSCSRSVDDKLRRAKCTRNHRYKSFVSTHTHIQTLCSAHPHCLHVAVGIKDIGGDYAVLLCEATPSPQWTWVRVWVIWMLSQHPRRLCSRCSSTWSVIEISCGFSHIRRKSGYDHWIEDVGALQSTRLRLLSAAKRSKVWLFCLETISNIRV